MSPNPDLRPKITIGINVETYPLTTAPRSDFNPTGFHNDSSANITHRACCLLGAITFGALGPYLGCGA